MTMVLITLLAVVVALLVVLVAGLLRGQAHILRILHDLSTPQEREMAPPGDDRDSARRATDIAGTAVDGSPLEITVVGARRPTLLMFLTGTCASCAGLWSALADPRQLRKLADTSVAVVARGHEVESAERLERVAPRGLDVVMSTPAWAAYGVDVAPYFAYVGRKSDLIVAEGTISSWDDLVAACAAGAPRL